MTDLWGDVVGSWQLIVDMVKYIGLLISLNMVVIILGMMSLAIHGLMEFIGYVIVRATRSAITAMWGVKNKSMDYLLMNERELWLAKRDTALGMMWDLRNYVIRTYRLWQYGIEFIAIGVLWGGTIFVFLGAIMAGATAGDMTLVEYGMEILSNAGTMTVFVASIFALSILWTILMAAYRIARWGIVEEKIMGKKSIWATIKSNLNM